VLVTDSSVPLPAEPFADDLLAEPFADGLRAVDLRGAVRRARVDAALLAAVERERALRLLWALLEPARERGVDSAMDLPSNESVTPRGTPTPQE